MQNQIPRILKFTIPIILSWIAGLGTLHAQHVESQCSLSPYDSVGNFHSVWLKDIPGQANKRYLFDAQGGTLTQYDDSTALISGRIVNVDDANQQWDVRLWLIGESDYATWSSMGRTTKTGSAPSAVVNANKQDWTFWELDSTRSIFAGVSGTFFAGDTLYVSHKPVNRVMGFQFGQGANDKNGGFGLSGWFFFTGSYNSYGDVNTLVSCRNGCDLSVTEAKAQCISDSLFQIRLTFEGSGDTYEITDNQGTTLLSGVSAGSYILGPYTSNQLVNIQVKDTLFPNCDTTIYNLLSDCTPLQVCNLIDYDTVGDFHAIYLFNYPGQSSKRYLFDPSEGQLTIFNDGTALITGRVINALNANQAWDMTFWLEKRRDFSTWSSLGRDIKIEQAPDSIANANKQDWFFWEVDSTRSTLTGVPGTQYAGDTLFVSHDPPNREFGFQFGVAANSKTNGLGLSGWFRFTGSFTDHGDINVLSDCGDGILCDLRVTHAQAQCINKSTFEIEVSFTGSGSAYQIKDAQGNIYANGVSAGTYFIGPFANGTLVDLQIIDTAFRNCDTTLVGLTEDCTPPCDLQVTSSAAHCVSKTDFVVEITFTGTGNGFVLTDNQGSPSQGGAAGSYTFGPYPSNTIVDIVVEDTAGLNCDTTLTGFTQDCTPPCDLQVTSATPNCISKTQFEIEVVFTGTGNGYVLTDNQGNPVQSGAAGTYTFGPYNSNTLVDISVVDTNGLNCDTTLVGITEDCTPPCDLQVTSATPNCISKTQFEIEVVFTGTGNGYVLTDNQGNSAQSGAAGTYTFGPYNSNTLVDISVVDTNGLNCDTTLVGITEDCTPPCDLQVTSVTPNCISKTQFEIEVVFTGTGNGYVLTDNQGNPVQSGAAGTYTFGPYNSNTLVDISVVDTNGLNCDTTLVGITEDCTPPCDLQVISATPNCISNTQFEIQVVFTGTGNGYVLTDNQGNPTQSGAAGTYTFGPYNSNTLVDISVVDTNGLNCDTTLVGITEDCTPPCDLQILSATPTCINSAQFEITVNFSGTGNGFVLMDDQNSPAQSGAAGSYTFGPYSNNTLVSITISDTTGVNCDSTLTGLTQDCTQPCDLQVLSTTPNCISNTEFDITVVFTGSGNGFMLADNQGNPVQSGAAGTYTFGPYPSNTLVDISIMDTNSVNCDTLLMGITTDCTPPCDLQLTSATPVCLNNNQFQINVSFTGSGNGFVLTDNQGSLPQSGAAGTYTFGPYANNTLVNLSITDTNGVNCDTTLVGITEDCTPPCDLQVSSVTPVCLNSNEFEIQLVFTGSAPSYNLTDNQGSAPQSGAAGSYTFGPYSNNTVVNITIADPSLVGCDTTLVGITEDCSLPCDLNVASATPVCTSTGEFNILVDLAGSSANYTLTDDQGSQAQSGGAGIYTFGPYPNNTIVAIDIVDANNSTCDTTITGISTNCPLPCDLNVTSSVANCVGNTNTFDIVVDFTGSGTNYQLSDNQGNPPQSGTAGTYVFGPYLSGTQVDISIIDQNNTNCDTLISGLGLSCTPFCDLNIDTIFTSCINRDSFEIRMVLNGSGTNYQISDNLGMTQAGYTGSLTDTISFGTYFNSTDVFITVSDLNIPNCDTTIGPLTDDCTSFVICDIVLDSVTTFCSGPDSFCVQVHFSGSPANYLITDNLFFNVLSANSAGTYTLGCYPNNTPVVATITNTDLFGCALSFPAVSEDCTPPPANNLCTSPELLDCGATIAGSTVKANEDFLPGCSSLQGQNQIGVWYLVEGTGQAITASTCSGSVGTNTTLSAFVGDCDNLNCIATSLGSSNCTSGGEITFLTNIGEFYYIYVSTEESHAGPFNLSISCLAFEDLVPRLSATDKKTHIRLDWSVLLEKDVMGYTIERSIDGQIFESIGYTNSTTEDGNSDSQQFYQFEDYSAEFNKMYYYRVKQEYFDGKEAFSEIAAATLFSDNEVLVGNLYPNPARTAFNIDIYSVKDMPLALYLYDEAGRLLKTYERGLRSGNNTLEFEVSWLISGIYTVQFNYNGKRESRRLVLVR